MTSPLTNMFLLVPVLLALHQTTAWAEPRVRIAATDPPGSSVTLAPNASFYVRLDYQSEQPIRLWARPYWRGAQIQHALTNASLEYVGTGEALAWFALSEPAQVDEIRIIAGSGDGRHDTMVATQAIDLRARVGAAARPPTAAWVQELSQLEQRRLREERARTPAETAETLPLFGAFMLVALVLTVASVAWPLRALWSWNGPWRVAAALPLALLAFVVLRIIVGVTRDPTSHNLWPFEILQAAGISVATIAALTVARWLSR